MAYLNDPIGPEWLSATPSASTASLADLFVAHRQALLKSSARIVGNIHLAEDVVQEAFIKIGIVQPGQQVRSQVGYLFQIVHNLSIDYYRRRVREEHVIAPPEDGELVPSPEALPETRLADRQALDCLSQALAELPPRTRRAFELCRVHGMAQKEVARQLGVSPTLVNFMIKDALTHCRLRLKR